MDTQQAATNNLCCQQWREVLIENQKVGLFQGNLRAHFDAVDLAVRTRNIILYHLLGFVYN